MDECIIIKYYAIFIIRFDVELFYLLGYNKISRCIKKGVDIMPNIKPISDLRNYSSVLNDVAVGSPVYLTKNGRGCYAIVDIKDQEEYEKTKAQLKLMCELEKGHKSGEEKGWLSAEDVRAHFRAKTNDK